MFRKSYLYLIFAAAFLLAGQMVVYSQQGAAVSGKVVLQKADGALEPVVGALVEAIRIDIKAGSISDKTDKKGYFSFVSIAYGAEYALSVSAPNCAPEIYPDIKAGNERIVITMQPGDGRKWTEAEVKKAIADGKSGIKTGEKTSEGEPAELTEAQKKEKAEYDAAVARNEKIKQGNEVASRSFNEGSAALDAKNYDLALTKFNEGVAAIPDFIGSTPILLKGKVITLKMKGFLTYKEGVGLADRDAKRSKYDVANKFYDDGLVAFQDAVKIINQAAPAADPADQQKRDTLKRDLYAEASEIYRLKVAGSVDLTKAADSSSVITDYIAMESDPAKKLATQMVLGDIMRLTGDLEKAVAAYRQVLVLKPDHAEAMGKLGLSLFAQGAAAMPEDKEMEQEGLNYMQKYIDTAPVSATDTQVEKELKMSIKESVDYLKSQKMAPQKTPAGKKKQ